MSIDQYPEVRTEGFARISVSHWGMVPEVACKHPRRIGEGSMSCDRWATSWRCLDCGYSEKFSG